MLCEASVFRVVWAYVRVNKGVRDVLQVFHLYVVLGIQDLLRLRLYVAGVSDSDCCHRLCDHRLHVLLAER